MIDVTSRLRTAIIGKLRNNVRVDGSAVRVFGRIASTTSDGTYIYLPTLESRNGSGKQFFSTDSTVTVECVYRNVNDDLNSSGLDIMVYQVKGLLAVKSQSDMPQPDGLGMVDFEFVSKTELIDLDDLGPIYRAVLTFEAIIDEG